MADRPTTTAGILRAAADLIEARGLHKGEFGAHDGHGIYPPNCPVCALGAINVAVGGDPVAVDMRAAQEPLLMGTIRALARHVDPHSARSAEAVVVAWSDHPDRTAAEVAAAMRAAAQEVDR